MNLRAITVQGEDDWARARAIRMLVFVREQGVPVALELDELDPLSTHALVEDGGVAVATGRLIPAGHAPALAEDAAGGFPDQARAETGKIGRMAVLAPWRGRGAGSLLMDHLTRVAATQRLTHLMLSAQTHAVPFYARHGYRVVSAQFMDAGIPHVWMRRALTP